MLSDNLQDSIDEAPGRGTSWIRARAAVEERRNTLPVRRPTPSWPPSTPTSSGCRKANRHPRPCPPFTPSAQRCSSCRGVSRVWPAAPVVKPHRNWRPNISSSNSYCRCSNMVRRRADAASATGMPSQICVCESQILLFRILSLNVCHLS